MNIPSQTNRPRCRKTFVCSEYRSPVRTKVDIQQIASIINITSIQVEIGIAIFILRIAWLPSFRIAIGKTGSCKIAFRESLSRKTFRFHIIFTDIGTDSNIYHVLTSQ